MKTSLFVLAGIIALLISVFMPFDWWQKAPSMQRDKFIGRLLGGFLDISLRNVLLRTILLGNFLYPFLMLLVILPFLAPFVLAGMTLYSLHQRFCRRVKSAVPLPGLVLIFAFGCLFTYGLLAPLRTIPLIGYFVLGRPAGTPWEGLTVGKDWVWIDSAIGIAGIFAVSAWMLIDSVWRWRQYMQIKNIPTSSVRSLAMGLVEVKGVVRPLLTSLSGGKTDGVSAGPVEITDGLLYGHPRRSIIPFCLDDGTGEVIVDATTCHIRARAFSELLMAFGRREIVLTRRRERNEFSDSEKRWLQYGDRVYVIGNAERGRDGTPVIRPAARTDWNEILWKMVFGVIRPPENRDIHDVFFMTDGDEGKAARHVLRGFRSVLSWGLIWMACSITLLWSAQQPWKKEPPLDSWRGAYWRGPEPNPDPRIMDFTRNERLFRFEKYMKTLGPHSHDQVPALMEAMASKDYRFRGPATSALGSLMSKKDERAADAVALLINNLHPCGRDAKTLQTTIVALGKFGRKAAPAVPALIEQLKCRKTNTYEVSPNIIRMQAARTLGEIGPEAREAIPALTEALNDLSPSVRESSALAIRKIGASGQ